MDFTSGSRTYSTCSNTLFIHDKPSFLITTTVTMLSENLSATNALVISRTTPSSHIRTPLLMILLAAGVLAGLMFPPVVLGQDSGSVDVNITGGIQPRLTAGVRTQDNGEDVNYSSFGIRRGRLDINATIAGKYGINYDVDLSFGSAATVDIFLFYQPSDRFRVRFGYFNPPQPRAYITTSYVLIDGIDRASIAERWADNTHGLAARDFGIEAIFTNGETTLGFAILNGDGRIPAANSRQSVARTNDDLFSDLTSFAYNAYASHLLTPGLEIGAYASYNGRRAPRTAYQRQFNTGRTYVSWSTHAHWGSRPGSQPLRLKLDVIGTHFDSNSISNSSGFSNMEENIVGWSATGAIRIVQHGEFYARFESETNDMAPDHQFIESGVMYSLSARKGLPFHRHLVTLGYQGGYTGGPVSIDQHQVVLQTQIVF